MRLSQDASVGVKTAWMSSTPAGAGWRRRRGTDPSEQAPREVVTGAMCNCDTPCGGGVVEDCIGPNDRTRRLEALPSHATAICGLVRGVLSSFRLHIVDFWIGRLADFARSVDGVHMHGAGACASGPVFVASGPPGRHHPVRVGL